ncbi:hypothetical protein ACROYT_G018231 [Oculina patagonica]
MDLREDLQSESGKSSSDLEYSIFDYEKKSPDSEVQVSLSLKSEDKLCLDSSSDEVQPRSPLRKKHRSQDRGIARQQQQQQQQFGPFMNELHSQLNVGEGSQSRPVSASSDITSSPTSPVAVASTSTASFPESGPAKRTYDKWVRR